MLLASLTVLPIAMCLGLDLQEWIAVLINLRYVSRPPRQDCVMLTYFVVISVRARTPEDIFLASTAIGAALGAYVGALPIPLDWDRPWQQWPLTCVYGSLAGHALGIIASVMVTAWLKPRAIHQVKAE
ncbi:Phosphatidylinositol-glycan biosynthesis class f protein, partial [Globisporangium splendens]